MIEVVTAQQPITTKKITRASLLSRVVHSRWSLPIILAFQTLLSYLLLQNTAFQDEALYLYAGRQIWNYWSGGQFPTDHYSFYFSGYPYLYPVIGGLLDMWGGLELARTFSLLCMLLVTACGYYVTKKLFDQKSAVLAALFFVCQGPTLFLGRLATYDALCLCLLAVGTAIAVKVSQGRRFWLALSLGPILVLAVGAKYAALLFLPSILALLAICTFFQWGWRRMVMRSTLALLPLIMLGILSAAIIIKLDPDVLRGIQATTTNRNVLELQSRWGLVTHIVQISGLSLALALVGLLFARKRQLVLACFLLGSALLAPAYHIYKAELVSLDKHLAFSMFFAMPVAGYALASLCGLRRTFLSGRYWLSGMALCFILFLQGTQAAQAMYQGWPSTAQLSYVLNTQVRDNIGYYLAEQFEVSRYNLDNDTAQWQWTGLDFFAYTDAHGKQYTGNAAYTHAIQDGYFSLIQINYGYNAATATIVAQAIAQSKKYDLIAKVPYQNTYGTGYFWVWRKH